MMIAQIGLVTTLWLALSSQTLKNAFNTNVDSAEEYWYFTDGTIF